MRKFILILVLIDLIFITIIKLFMIIGVVPALIVLWAGIGAITSIVYAKANSSVEIDLLGVLGFSMINFFPVYFLTPVPILILVTCLIVTVYLLWKNGVRQGG